MGKAISRPLIMRCSSSGFPNEGFSTQASERGSERGPSAGSERHTLEQFLSSLPGSQSHGGPAEAPFLWFGEDGGARAGQTAGQLRPDLPGFMLGTHEPHTSTHTPQLIPCRVRGSVCGGAGSRDQRGTFQRLFSMWAC